MSNNAHELSNRLLNALDNNYNVVDMQAVNEIISILERFNITKELLETTRLGKHVNELRRKTSDPSLARRAKVLVKRWRDLVIPTVASPGHPGSNRSSAERQVRRLGTTPLTSPALTRHVVSPAVASPRPPSRPTWGGYESDSQDVILVDDDPPSAPPPPPPAHPALPTHKPITPPVKRPLLSEPLNDEKKAKRDKKIKKKRGPSRAGTGAEGNTVGADLAPPGLPPAHGVPGLPPGTQGSEPWAARNGGAHSDRRRNGYRTHHQLDPYAALAQRMPPTTGKKVKTTKELLEQIQSRGTKPVASPPSFPASPHSPHSPHSPDVMLIEPDSCPLVKVDSPLRNGAVSPAPCPLPPLEDEREYWECTCDADADEAACLAARRTAVRPLHVRALHHAYLPGVNGTRAPLHPHKFAVRPPGDSERPGLFASVVPLYKYSDYADDRCAKNMDRVPLCPSLPWTEFAPPPPDLPPPPTPPSPRPYPLDEESPTEIIKREVKTPEPDPDEKAIASDSENSDRLKAPLLPVEVETLLVISEPKIKMEVAEEHTMEQRDHRTVERTKEELNGQMLYDKCQQTIDRIEFDYGQFAAAPVVTLPVEEVEALDVLTGALAAAETDREPDELGRPQRPENFAEWHECALLGQLIALPYVVID